MIMRINNVYRNDIRSASLELQTRSAETVLYINIDILWDADYKEVICLILLWEYLW